MKILKFCFRIPLIITLFWGIRSYSEWGKSRSPAAFSKIPQEKNEKSIVECLDRLKGFISTQETTNLNNLKTKIERIYGMKQSVIQYRELLYKNPMGEKWRVEFYLTSDSLKGKEKYRLKYFKLKEGEGFSETLAPDKEDVVEISKMLKFGHAEEIETDERWERFGTPLEPDVSFKSKNFNVFELSATSKRSKSKLLCNIAGGHPFCQCSIER